MAISLLTAAAQLDDDMAGALVELVTNESIFLKLFKFVTTEEIVYTYSQASALPGIAFRGLNENYNTSSSIVNPAVETLAILGGQINTDRQLWKRKQGVARRNELARAVKNAGLFYDYNVIKGDPAVNVKGFYGLQSRISGNQLISAGTNGGAVTQALIDQMMDAVLGGDSDKILVCNKACRRAITTALRANIHFIAMVPGTAQVDTYRGAPIYVLDEDGTNNPILAENETMGSSSATTSLYCIKLGGDIDETNVQGIVSAVNGGPPVEHDDIGLLGTFYVDIVEMLGGMGVFHPRAAARLAGILP